MASSLFDLLPFLWPEDTELSERDPWLVQVYHLSVVGGVLIPVFGVLYQLLPTAYVDPWGIRLTIAELFVGLFGSSYVSARLGRHHMPLMWDGPYALVAGVGRGPGGPQRGERGWGRQWCTGSSTSRTSRLKWRASTGQERGLPLRFRGLSRRPPRAQKPSPPPVESRPTVSRRGDTENR